MEEIIKTEEGQRFFNFLDTNWGAVCGLVQQTPPHGQSEIKQSILKIIEVENEMFDFDLFEENEFDSIVQYFVNMGSSY